MLLRGPNSAHGLRVAAALLVSPCVRAGDGSWTNPGGGSWASAANWSAGSIASGGGAVAGFTAVDLIMDGVVTLDGPKSVGGLFFGDSQPSHDWVLRGGSGGVLTLNAGLGAAVIHVANRAATLGVPIAGTGGLVKTGAGVLVLTGQNAYTGPTTVAGGTLRLGAPPVFPQQAVIMPIGDSITYGYNGANAGYRGPLHDYLTSMGFGFRFEGTSKLRSGQLPTDQRQHEGHSSYNIQDVHNNLDGFDNERFLQYGAPERNPNGGYWLTGGNGTGREAVEPDLIMMMVGTNDLDILEGAETRLRNLITKIITLRPLANLLLAKVTPLPLHPNENVYNEIVARVAADFRAAGNRVFLVDLNSQFPSNGLDPDAVHPNDIGFQWMALQWHEAVIRVYTPEGGDSAGIPADSPVSIEQGALLDLNGTHAASGGITASGRIDLGQGGDLSAVDILIDATGSITGSGTVRGTVIHNGSGIGLPGTSLVFTDPVTNNGTIEPAAGSSLHFGSMVINNGSLSTGSGQSLVFSQGLMNNGYLHVTGDMKPVFGGTFINNGMLDISGGLDSLPGDFTNNGLVFDSSPVETHSFSVTGNTVTLAIQSGPGSSYQLQHSPTLAPGSWHDLGAPQTGAAGAVLTFTADREPSAVRGFYRIRVTR